MGRKVVARMSVLPLLLTSLGTSYTAFGCLVARKASKPSCRVCVFRELCPSRLRGRDEFTKIPVCLIPVRPEAPAEFIRA